MTVMAVAAVAAVLAVTIWQFAPAMVLSALLGLCLVMGAVFLLVERRTEAVWQARLRRWIRHRGGRER
jgi:fatty acid desaturase